MLAIKLKLIGKKGQHSFRVVVQEKRSKLQGASTDDLGWFNPHTNQLKINQERLKHWLGNGAQPTESVSKVLKNAKDSSEVQGFKGRTRAKRRKKEKVTAQAPSVGEAALPEASPEAPAEAEAPAETSQEKSEEGS